MTRYSAPSGARPTASSFLTSGSASRNRPSAGETTDDLFGFLTTEPNAEVAPIHPKAMPAILTKPDEWGTWLTAEWTEAKRLQRPLADGMLEVVQPG